MKEKKIEIFDFKRCFASKLLFFNTHLSDNVIYYIVLRIISQASRWKLANEDRPIACRRTMQKCKVDDNKLFAINNEGFVIEKYEKRRFGWEVKHPHDRRSAGQW